MNAYPNHTKHQLAAGKLALGMGLRQARTCDIAAIAKTSGFDWLFIDMEHSSLDVDTAAQIANAALAVGITPIVRVPGKEHHHASRLLDAGAQGVVVPHVDTVEEAQRAVSYCKYPPIGHRSMAGAQPQFAFQSVSMGEAATVVNAETLVIVMLETPTAIANAEAIAAVPGIDSLLIGTNDLAMELGIPGGFADERIVAAYQTVVDACRAHGKFAGVGGIADRELLRRYIGMGVRLVLPGSDLSFMTSAAGECAAAMRAFL